MLNDMATSLAQNLILNGIEVLKVSPSSKNYDPILWITEKLHLQVGIDHVHVVYEQSKGKYIVEVTNGSIKDIMLKLKDVTSK